MGASAGTYVLTGKFTKDQITERAWRKQLKQGAIGDKKAKHPAFAVESWCFQPVADLPEHWVDLVAQMKKSGVTICK